MPAGYASGDPRYSQALNQRAFYMPPAALRGRLSTDIARLTDIIKRAHSQLV